MKLSTALVAFLSRLSLLGVTFGGLEMQLSGPKTDFGAQGAPRPPSREINSPFWLHFGTPKIIKKWPEPFFKGAQKWFQKQAHIQGAKMWDFATIYYTWARSDVSEMDPFWELFEDQFCTLVARSFPCLVIIVGDCGPKEPTNTNKNNQRAPTIITKEHQNQV